MQTQVGNMRLTYLEREGYTHMALTRLIVVEADESKNSCSSAAHFDVSHAPVGSKKLNDRGCIGLVFSEQLAQLLFRRFSVQVGHAQDLARGMDVFGIARRIAVRSAKAMDGALGVVLRQPIRLERDTTHKQPRQMIKCHCWTK